MRSKNGNALMEYAGYRLKIYWKYGRVFLGDEEYNEEFNRNT